MSKIPKAKLISEIPKERYRSSGGVSVPQVGDILELDQGFTSEDGKAMVIAYHPTAGGKESYEVELYETEIKLIE